MILNKAGSCLIITLLLVFSSLSYAQNLDELFDFDVYLQNDFLTVKLNLEPFISSTNLSQMKDGIDLAMSCEMSLEKRKKVWGSKTIIKNILG